MGERTRSRIGTTAGEKTVRVYSANPKTADDCRGPKISVIVPVYKVEPYLRRCVDSILAQTYRDFELILVDDGSPDKCGEICDEYAKQDSRVVVIHQPNGGLSAARNAGIEWMETHSASEWVTFADSDDMLYPDYLSCLLHDVMQSGTEVAVCGYRRVKSLDDAEVKTELCDSENEVKVLAPEQFWILNWELSNVAWCKLYSRSIFTGVRYPIGRINEDAFVTYKVLFSQKEISYREGSHYNHLVRSDSIMGERWSPKRFDDADAIEGQIDYFRENGYLTTWKHVARTHIHHMGLEGRRSIDFEGEDRKYCHMYKKRIVADLKGRCRGCGFRLVDSYNVCRVIYPHSFHFVWPFLRICDFIGRRGLFGSIRYLWAKCRDE